VLGQAHNALGDREASIHAFREGARIGHDLGMTAMAHELQVAAAMVGADAGRADASLAEVTAILGSARSSGSVITASWAWATRVWIMVRLDPAGALEEVGAALAEARAIDYPMAIGVDLRSKAFAHLLLDDLAATAATVDELLTDLVDRGALSNLRLLADVTAALAHRLGNPLAEPLLATARSLPITTVSCAQFEVVELPPVDVPPLPRQQVINVVRAVLADASTAVVPGRDDGSAVTAAPTARISMSGDICQIDFEGRSVSMRSTKGLTDIIRLVAAGGTEIHCTELGGVAVQQSSTGEVIDTSARRRYEERIRELQADIDEAERDNDLGRSYRSQVELDALIEHLTASLGRGHRTRRGSDTTERARSAVTHRLKASIRQLTRVHATLGRHFEHSIRTGVYCSYRPERAVAWVVDAPAVGAP
jgi:hypothetical protein